MAGGIKGITVKIGGDTTELGRSLKESAKMSEGLSRELKQVNNLLKFDPKNTTLLKQQQDLLSESIQETTTKLENLKAVQEKVNNGEIKMTAEEYRNLEREIANAEAELKKLTEQQRNLSQIKTVIRETTEKSASLAKELKGVNTLLKFDPKNTELLKQKQDLLNESIETSKTKLKALKDMQAMVNGGEIEMTAEEYRDLQREIAATEQAVQRLTKEQTNFGSVAAQKIASYGEDIKKLGNGMTNAGKAMMPVTLAITGAGAAAVKTGAEFDASMSKVQAISGATTEELEELRNKAREMGADTKFSAQESAEALNYMAMAGWKTDDMLNGLSGVMSLAAASGADLASTSDIVTDAMTAFGMEAGEAEHFADVLAQSAVNANTNVTMMGESFKYVAPVAGAFGFSVEDTAVALGIMANSGIKSSQAGMALRTALTNLANPTDKMAGAMSELGVSITKPDGSMKNLQQIMTELRGSMANLTEEERAVKFETIISSADAASVAMEGLTEEEAIHQAKVMEGNRIIEEQGFVLEDWKNGLLAVGHTKEELDSLSESEIQLAYATQLGSASMEGLSQAEQVAAAATIFGKNSMAGMLALINASDEDFDALSDSIDNCGGAAKAMADIMEDNLAGDVTKAKSKLGDLAITVSDILNPILRSVVQRFNDLIDKFRAMSPTAQKLIVVIAGIVSAIAPVLVVGGKLLSGVGTLLTKIPTIVGHFNKIKTGLTGVGTAMGGISAPALAVAAVIGTLVAVFIHLWNTNEGFRDAVIGIWERIKEIISNVVDKVKGKLEILGQKFSELYEKIKPTLDLIATGLGQAFVEVFNLIADEFDIFCDIFMSILDAFGALFTGDWTALWESMKDIFFGILDAIGTLFSDMWDGILNVIDSVCPNAKQKIVTFVSESHDKVKEFTQKMWSSFKDNFAKCLTTTTEKFNSIKETVSTKIADAANAVSKKGTEIAKSAKTFATTTYNNIKAEFGKIAGAVGDAMQAAWNKLTGWIGQIRNKVAGIFDGIIPKLDIKLPSINVSYTDGLFGLKIPHFDVAWHALGGIFDKPTLLPSMNGKMHGVAEKEPEAIAPLSKLMGYVSTAVNDSKIIDKLDKLDKMLDKYLPELAQDRQVVLDSGALVGRTVNKYDKALGGKRAKAERGW